MDEEWKKVWYHKPTSTWIPAQTGVWCHVRNIGAGRWVCKEFAEDREAHRNVTAMAWSSCLDEDYIDFKKNPPEEVNEFGVVSP